jgi:NodT family efflux transporter outer membrane factor (OMF) lipoprotein
MKKIVVTCLLASMSMTTACTSMAPKYEVPKMDFPNFFKEMTPEKRDQLSKWKPGEPGKVENAAWWTKYNDPILNDLENQVLSSNLLIVQAVENFNQAKALVKQAQSQWYPTVGLAPSYTGQRGVPTGSTTPTLSTYTTTTVPVVASWVPDIWGKVASAVDQSKASSQVSEADLEAEKLTEEVTLATTYFELRAQDEMQRVLDDTVKDYQESVRINDVLLRTGIGNQESLLQAQTQLLTARAQATNLHIARAQYEHAIALLVGQPASTFSLKETSFNVVIPDVPVGIPSQVLQRRPDVAAAERNMAAANAEIGVARAAYFPSLSINGNAGLEMLASVPAFIWSLGATLSETIFDGGSRNATLDQFKAAYRFQVASYKQTVLTSFQQVEDELAALHHLDIEVHQQDAAVDASQKYVDIAQSRFKLGIDPYLTVVEAQITLLTNKESAVTIRLQQLLASAQLVEAVGGDWDRSKLSDGSDTDVTDIQKKSDEKADSKSASVSNAALTTSPVAPNASAAVITPANTSTATSTRATDSTIAPNPSPAAITPVNPSPSVSPGAPGATSSAITPNPTPAAITPANTLPATSTRATDSTIAPNPSPATITPVNPSPGASPGAAGSAITPNPTPAAVTPVNPSPISPPGAAGSAITPNPTPAAVTPVNPSPSASTGAQDSAIAPNPTPAAVTPVNPSPSASPSDTDIAIAPNPTPVEITPVNPSPSASPGNTDIVIAPNPTPVEILPVDPSPSTSPDDAGATDSAIAPNPSPTSITPANAQM